MSKLKLATGALCGVIALSAHAFKPDSDHYGHKMITQGVLSDEKGYSFGVKIPGFKPMFTNGLESAVGANAIKWITYGAMSRDFSGTVAQDRIAFGSDDDWLAGGAECATFSGPKFAAPSANSNSMTLWTVDGKGFCISSDLADGAGHFDNDNILGSTKAIQDHVNEAIILLGSYQRAVDDGSSTISGLKGSGSRQTYLAGARMMLGKALHTLQDFYAHSNWADTHSTVGINGSPQIFSPITNFLIGGDAPWKGFTFSKPLSVKDYASYLTVPALAQSAVNTWLAPTGASVPTGNNDVHVDSDNQTCTPNVFSNFSHVTDLSSWIVDVNGFNDGNWALTQIALHPDFITTGAWWANSVAFGGNGVAAAQDGATTARCDHGSGATIGLDTARVMGIAKDAPWMPLAGHGPRDGRPVEWDDENAAKAEYEAYSLNTVIADATDVHKRASDAAAFHTKELLNIFVQQVKDSVPANLEKADRMLASFFDTTSVQGGRLKGFVIDRSATMYDVLPTLVAEIKSQLGTDPNPRVALISFADVSDVSVPTIGDAVRAELDKIVARGGGGCQTPVHLATKRLFQAVNERLPGVRGMDVTYFTDAGALVSVTDPMDGKPVTLKTITDLASQTKSTVTPVVSGACSPLDPSHIGVASQTNAPLLVVEQSAAGMAAGVAGAFDGGDNPRAVYVENASITTGKIISFPVETGAAKLKISLAHNAGSYAIRQPDGIALTPPSPGGFSAVMNADAVTVDSPQPGDWQLELMPGGAQMDYSLQATVNNTIEFHDIEFVSVLEVGRPGHEYSPRHGKVGQTGQSRALVHMVGAVSNLHLQALGFDGAVLGDWALTDRDGTHFDAVVRLPSVEYRPRVVGVDATGKVFSRMLATALPPAVAAPKGAFDLQAIVPAWQEGGANAFGVLITNLGGDDSVTLSASSSGGFAVSMTDSSLLVPGSSRAKAMGSLNLPIRAPGSTVDIVVRSSGGTEKTLSIQVPSFVVVPSAPVSVTASAGNAQAAVNFAAPTDNGGAAITGYTVTSTPGNLTSTGTASPLTVTGLINGTSYTFTVRASNVAGAGVASAASNGVIPAVPQFALGVTLAGRGSGTVNSDPAGIACGATCTANFASGSSVTLTAAPNSGSAFGGWGGACTDSSNTCTVSLDAAKSVTANFASAGYSVNGDGTVTDAKTGLTWMRCAMGQTLTGNTCAGTVSTYTWDQANALTGAVNFAGQSDWRLPNVRELLTILDRTLPSPMIDAVVFPNASGPGTRGSVNWTSTPYLESIDMAWYVNFDNGHSSAGDRLASVGVRLVRDSQSFPSRLDLSRPAADYVYFGDGTVAHIPTNLMWKRCAEGQAWNGTGCAGIASGMTLAEATSLSSTFAGRSGWRVPTISELLSLVDYGRSFPAANNNAFNATQSDLFLSSSLMPGNLNAWGMHFATGDTLTGATSGSFGVRLVREAEPISYFALTVNTTGYGNVSSNSAGIACGVSCNANFANGASVTLTATPAGGSIFSGWSGACTGTSTTCTVTMDASKSVTASFALSPTAPGVPTSVSASAGNAQATVTFVAPSNTGSGTITGYTVTSSPTGGVDSNAGSTALSHTITELTNGTVYTFTVTATNSAGTGVASAASNSVTPVGAIVATLSPAASSMVSSIGGAGTVSVTTASGNAWTATSNASWISVTSGATGSGNGTAAYSVLANSGGTSRSGTLTVAGQTFTVTQASSAGQVVFADNFDGSALQGNYWTARGTGAMTVSGGVANSACSATADTKGKYTVSGNQIVVEARMVGAGASRDTVIYLVDVATGDLIQVGDTTYFGRGMYTFGSGAFNLPSVGVSPSVNVYKEYRLTLDGTSLTFERGDSLANVSATTTRTLGASIAGRTFAISIGTGGPNYCPGSYDWIRVMSVTGNLLTPTVPDAPSNVTSTVGNASATISFTAPVNSGGSAVTGYTVTSNPAGGVDGNAGTTALTHTITGLTNGTAYTFTVIATNSTGTSLPSASSNSVTPLGVQLVTFGASPTVVVGGTGTVSATGGASGNPVIFSSTTTGVCTVSGTNGSTVAGISAGTCIIAANQVGSAAYAAAAQVTQSITIGQGSGQSLSLAPGWNLLGNSLNQALSVVPTFADTAIVTTVWKWDILTAGWQFYTPVLTSATLQTYAASKNYGVLSVINPGEGYWVNAKAGATLGAQTGTAFTLTSANLVMGWNLVATGADVTPSAFNLSLSATPPSPGTIPINLISLWAWDTPLSAWYFYAPALEANGGLANYITSKGYLDFTQSGKKLGNGTGFWVNRP